MQKIPLVLSLCLVLSVSLLLIATSLSNQPATQPAKNDKRIAWGLLSNNLQCRLLPLTQIVEVSERTKPEEIQVYLTYELRNMGDESLTFFVWYCPLADGFVFDVEDPDETRPSYLGPIPARAPRLSDFITIQPGQTVARHVRLLYDFSKIGTYKVSTRKSNDAKVLEQFYCLKDLHQKNTETAEQNPDNVWIGLIESNTVTINIVRPATQPAL